MAKKYFITQKDMYNYVLETHSNIEEREHLESAYKIVNSLLDKMGYRSFFCFRDRQTIESIFVEMVANGTVENITLDNIKPICLIR